MTLAEKNVLLQRDLDEDVSTVAPYFVDFSIRKAAKKFNTPVFDDSYKKELEELDAGFAKRFHDNELAKNMMECMTYAILNSGKDVQEEIKKNVRRTPHAREYVNMCYDNLLSLLLESSEYEENKKVQGILRTATVFREHSLSPLPADAIGHILIQAMRHGLLIPSGYSVMTSVSVWGDATYADVLMGSQVGMLQIQYALEHFLQKYLLPDARMVSVAADAEEQLARANSQIANILNFCLPLVVDDFYTTEQYENSLDAWCALQILLHDKTTLLQPFLPLSVPCLTALSNLYAAVLQTGVSRTSVSKASTRALLWESFSLFVKSGMDITQDDIKEVTGKLSAVVAFKETKQLIKLKRISHSILERFKPDLRNHFKLCANKLVDADTVSTPKTVGNFLRVLRLVAVDIGRDWADIGQHCDTAVANLCASMPAASGAGLVSKESLMEMAGKIDSSKKYDGAEEAQFAVTATGLLWSHVLPAESCSYHCETDELRNMWIDISAAARNKAALVTVAANIDSKK